jgi:general stress protein YciG
MRLPKEIREQFARAGRRGGKKKVPKGFAMMDPKARRNAARKGGLAQTAKGKKRGRPAKNSVRAKSGD